MNKPYWSRLIKMLQDDKTIETGLTIPYLYGAYNLLGRKVTTIKVLLEMMMKESENHFPLIQKCDVIMHDVVRLESKKTFKKSDEVRHVIDTGSKEEVILISYTTKLGDSIESVAGSLAGLYQAPIDNETFSWREKKWQKFTEEEEKKFYS